MEHFRTSRVDCLTSPRGPLRIHLHGADKNAAFLLLCACVWSDLRERCSDRNSDAAGVFSLAQSAPAGPIRVELERDERRESRSAGMLCRRRRRPAGCLVQKKRRRRKQAAVGLQRVSRAIGFRAAQFQPVIAISQ
jgi:hypothetical protein